MNLNGICLACNNLSCNDTKESMNGQRNGLQHCWTAILLSLNCWYFKKSTFPWPGKIYYWNFVGFLFFIFFWHGILPDGKIMQYDIRGHLVHLNYRRTSSTVYLLEFLYLFSDFALFHRWWIVFLALIHHICWHSKINCLLKKRSNLPSSLTCWK